MSTDWQDGLNRLRDKERLARKILGVPDHADLAAVKKAFHLLAMQHHPDKNPGDREAAKRFLNIMNAYEFLAKGEPRGWTPSQDGAPVQDKGMGGFQKNEWGYFCWWRENFLAGKSVAGDMQKTRKRRTDRPVSKPGDWW